MTEAAGAATPTWVDRLRRRVGRFTRLDVLFAFILLFGIALRVQVATSYGIFLDEGLNYPLSVEFARALATQPFSSAGFSADPLKPQFFRLAFGPATWGAFGFGPVPVRQLVYNVVLPTSGLTAGRLLAVAVATLLTAVGYVALRGRWPALALLVGAFAFLNPVGTFWETVMYTHYLFVPLTVLLLIVVARGDGRYGLATFAAGAVFGVLLSVQYYAVIFGILPLAAFVLATRGDARGWVPRLADLVRQFGVFLAVALFLFYLLNPLFWSQPISEFQSIVATQFLSQGNTLTTSSGVAGVPTFFGGSAHLLTPWYFPLEIFAVETPTAVLLALPFGLWVALRALRAPHPELPGRLALLAALALVVELAFSAPIQHFHSWADINLYLGPSAVLAGVGTAAVITWWGRRALAAQRERDPDLRTPRPRPGLWRLAAAGGRPFWFLVVVAVLLAGSTAVEYVAGPSYVNAFVVADGHPGAGLVGAYGSPQSDRLVGQHLSAIGLTNVTLVVLGFTVSVDYYSPPEHFVQLWQPETAGALEASYRGAYLDINEWYIQLWGDPIPAHDANFTLVYSVNVTGGFSQLWYLEPILQQVSPLIATPAQTIYLNGTDLGTGPRTEPIGKAPFVDTLIGGTTPSLAIDLYAANGSFLWEAGQATASGEDAIGVELLSWSDHAIVLGGFSPIVIATGAPADYPGGYTLSPGDTATFTVHAPNDGGVSRVTVPVAASASHPLLQRVSPIAASANQTITLSGLGFGASPVLVNLSGGWVDTWFGGTAPSLAFTVLAPNGSFLWEAGRVTATGRDAIGVEIVAWNSTSIVVRGFGPSVLVGAGTPPPGSYAIAPGDTVVLVVDGPEGSGGSAVRMTVGGSGI